MRILTAALAALFVVLVIGSASAEPRVWVGLEKTFTKPGYADWKSETYQDEITENVVITRADRKGIFNIAQEPGYKPSPPSGTEWAYGTASNWKNLRFNSFETWNSRVPPDAVGEDAVLHLLEEDVYLDIRFTSWSEGDGSGSGSGGGFSYTRATEGVSGETVWTGASITFTKADYADWTLMANQDRITSTVWITRRDKEGIFNIAQERGYRLNPPSGTEWALGAASSWAALSFQPLAKLHGDAPETMIGKAAVMHLLDEDVYVDVKFLTWHSYSIGAGFSYERSTEGTEGEKVWTGANIVFLREDRADWTTAAAQDRIAEGVWITRGRWGGIFNIASEESYEPYPPTGTEWSFGSAADWESLTFVSWEALAAQNPKGKRDPRTLVGKKIVVHLIEEDIYLDMMIDSWDADDTGGGFSWRRAENDPVTILDGPLALPSLVPLDDAHVSFRISVQDDDNEPIQVDWDYGDGTTGSGTITNHTYTAAGDYTATVTVTDGTDVLVRTVGVKVNTRPEIVTGPTASHRYCQIGETVDFEATVTDDDGNTLISSWDFGDDEEATGTTASHAFTAPGDYVVTFATTDTMHGTDATVEVTVAKPLVVDKVIGKVNYRRESRDSLKLKTTIELPVGFLPEGKMIVATFGGVEAEFLLDRRGRGKSLLGSAKLKFKKRTGLWQCQVKLRKGNFAAVWSDHGVVNETVKDVPLSFPALLRVDTSAFQTDAPALYRARETRTGRFKTPRQVK